MKVENYGEYKIEEIIKVFSERAIKSKQESRIFLWGIIFLVLIGILIIIFAGELDSNSPRKELGNRLIENEALYDSLQNEVNSFRTSVGLLFYEIQKFAADDDRSKRPGFLEDVKYRTTNPDDYLMVREEIINYVDSYDTLNPDSRLSKPRLISVDSVLKDFEKAYPENQVIRFSNMSKNLPLIRNDVQLLRDAVAQERLGIINNSEQQSLLDPSFIQTSITRFGTLILLFFFIRLLVPQYRYKLKMESYYLAKADSLAILKSKSLEGKIDFERLLTLLTPDINFTKEPEAPFDKVIELINLAKK